MSDAPELHDGGGAGPERRFTVRQMVEWAATGIGILTSGTAIWSAFTVLGATAENARARIFERQLDACLAVSETGTAFADSLSDARSYLDARAVMAGADPAALEAVFGPEQKRTHEAAATAQKAFARNVREIQILFPRSVSEAAVRLSAHGSAASALIDVAWEPGQGETVAVLPARIATVRDGIAALSDACADSLAGTAQLARE